MATPHMLCTIWCHNKEESWLHSLLTNGISHGGVAEVEDFLELGNDILRQELSYKCRVVPKHVCDDTHVHAANDVQP